MSLVGIEERLEIGSSNPDNEALRLDGGNGAVVVGPEAARCAGARMRRLACKITALSKTWE